MRPQRDDLVDRRKLEARQRVETKRTNRSIAFLCPELNQQSVLNTEQLIKIYTLWTSMTRSKRARTLVPIALGKYLFPFRTQKSSLVAAIILQQRETSKVPIYEKISLKREIFSCMLIQLKTRHKGRVKL